MDFLAPMKLQNKLSMTTRTLRTRLANNGTLFQAILDNVRKQLVIDYLESSSLNLEDIAAMVGYNDVSNLRRAFKKWTGKLPSDYRKIYQAN